MTNEEFEEKLDGIVGISAAELARLRANSTRMVWCLKNAFARDHNGLCFRRNYLNIEEFVDAVDAAIAAERKGAGDA